MLGLDPLSPFGEEGLGVRGFRRQRLARRFADCGTNENHGKSYGNE